MDGPTGYSPVDHQLDTDSDITGLTESGSPYQDQVLRSELRAACAAPTVIPESRQRDSEEPEENYSPPSVFGNDSNADQLIMAIAEAEAEHKAIIAQPDAAEAEAQAARKRAEAADHSAEIIRLKNQLALKTAGSSSRGSRSAPVFRWNSPGHSWPRAPLQAS